MLQVDIAADRREGADWVPANRYTDNPATAPQENTNGDSEIPSFTGLG